VVRYQLSANPRPITVNIARHHTYMKFPITLIAMFSLIVASSSAIA
jgi:hypothetical protein